MVYQLEGRFKLSGDNMLEAKFTHPDFVNVHNQIKNARMCSTHCDDHKSCGRCFMD